MIAGTANLVVDAQTDWYVRFVCQDSDGETVSLTGYTAVEAYVGRQYNDSAAIAIGATFVKTGGTTSTSGDGAGIVQISMTAEMSAGIDWKNGVYDVHVVEPSGSRTRIMQGQITIRPAVAAA